MDMMVTSVPGMEKVLRRRDIPRSLGVANGDDPTFKTMKTDTKRTVEACGLILNTFEDLEGPILDEIRKHIPNLYSIGPIHALLKARLESEPEGMESSHNHSSSLWEEDRSCIAWLDSQPTSSVIYVSFGSITILTRDELLEFWYGLVNSGHRFLWVMRPESIMGNESGNGNEIPVELEEGTKSRGCMVGWVPQQEVWPIQQSMTNSRFVSEVWKVGLDMKDTCDRITVEKMVKEVMDVRRAEFLERAHSMAMLVRKAISKGGTSYANLNRLIEFLKSMV
ncbi:UNVERIFIED_CONTAM: 7-deoxyloganetic acid glucosyl transferase [Sesamum angustifolium]|uniref:7-deoxyloganetic acid glucosyl transferase n=1 Tax=Sesamum angustifolium TaxID=2727405 RepID=A0AAW2PU28_9LAMI